MLATWMSYDDLERLVVACLSAPVLGHSVSRPVAQPARWWETQAASSRLRPHDSSSRFAPRSKPGATALDVTDPVVAPGRRVRPEGTFEVSPRHEPCRTSPKETQMKRRDWTLLCAVALAAGAVAPRPWAQRQDGLEGVRRAPARLPDGRGDPAHGQEARGRRPNGRISIQMYPSMQLGGEKEMIEQAQVGALQIARISVGAMGPVVDELNVFNMPFIFRDETHMRHVIDGPIGQELLEKISASPQSRLIALGWMDAGTRNVIPTSR
jgi:hypothetical protein